MLAHTQAAAGYIREATHSTLESLLIAVALSVLVIFPFLWSWPATLISALAIPTSLLGTAIIMALCGFELDTITLLALALVIGIIIDDAIVDVENIARHLEAGDKSPRHAASIAATQEIGPHGRGGHVHDCCRVPAGGVDARKRGPVLQAVRRHRVRRGGYFPPRGANAFAVACGLLAQTGGHARHGSGMAGIRALGSAPSSSEWSLRHRGVVILAAAASFAGGVALVPLIPKGLIPRLDRGEFKVVYRATRPGSDAANIAMGNPFAASLSAAEKIESCVRPFTDFESVYKIIGSSREGDPTQGVLHVRFEQGEKPPAPREIEDRLPQQPARNSKA